MLTLSYVATTFYGLHHVTRRKFDFENSLSACRHNNTGPEGLHPRAKGLLTYDAPVLHAGARRGTAAVVAEAQPTQVTTNNVTTRAGVDAA